MNKSIFFYVTFFTFVAFFLSGFLLALIRISEAYEGPIDIVPVTALSGGVLGLAFLISITHPTQCIAKYFYAYEGRAPRFFERLFLALLCAVGFVLAVAGAGVALNFIISGDPLSRIPFQELLSDPVTQPIIGGVAFGIVAFVIWILFGTFIKRDMRRDVQWA